MASISRAILVAIAVLCAPSAFAHGGGLNAEGCHNNRKTGDYHCHRAPGSPSVSRLAADTPPTAQASARSRTAVDAAPARPTCYVGPRGGTYTITASGRKNYGGC